MIVNDANQLIINKNISKLLKFPINNVNFNTNNNINKKNNISLVLNNKYINSLNIPKNNEKKINNNSELDDTLSQISLILNKDKKNLNYSGLVNKIPGIADKPNFTYNQILFNKKNINKAKILSKKISKIKLPTSEDSKFSDMLDEDKKKKNDNQVSISCCFFLKKNKRK